MIAFAFAQSQGVKKSVSNVGLMLHQAGTNDRELHATGAQPIPCRAILSSLF